MPMPCQKPHKSKQDYATPMVFIKPVLSLLGITAFSFDYAADDSNHKADSWWNEENNALHQPLKMWAVRSFQGWGWLNPPYTAINPWAERCLQTKELGGHIAFLVPASVGSNWYRDYIHNQYGVQVLFLNGRIPFMPNKPTWLYPKDCMLVLFGTEAPFNSDVWTWRS